MAWSDNLHRTHFPADGELHLRMLVAGYGVIGDWWKGSPPNHPFWVFYANDDDGAELVLEDGEVVSLAAGPVWLLPAWSVYNARCARPVRHHWVHFDPIGLAPLALRSLFTRPVPLPRDATLAGGCADLRTAALAGAETATGDPLILRCIAKSLALAALARLWRTLPAAGRQRLALSAYDAQLAPAINRIEEHLAQPHYSEALAAACGMSTAHFTRRFRAATGLSPIQFVLERRIARATEMLLLTDQPIEEIATELGFQDRFYFTRVFTRRMGRSPAAYRDHGRAPE